MKNTKRYVFIGLIYAVLILNFPNALSETKPVLNIKGNGITNQITLKPSDKLSVKIDINPGNLLGKNADWWIVANTPSGNWFSWVYPSGWVNIGSNLNQVPAAYRGALFTLNPYEVLNISNLGEGNYTIYFGIDTNMNGVLDYSVLTYSSLQIRVASSTGSGKLLYTLTGYFKNSVLSSTGAAQAAHNVTVYLYDNYTWKSTDSASYVSTNPSSSGNTVTDSGRYRNEISSSGNREIYDERIFSDPSKNVITDASYASMRFYASFPPNGSKASDITWKTSFDTYTTYKGICYEIIGTINDVSPYNKHSTDACSFTIK